MSCKVLWNLALDFLFSFCMVYLFSPFYFQLFCLSVFDMLLVNSSVQFTSVAQSCLILCDPMDCSTTGLPVHHQLLEFTQTHVHWVGDTIQPSYPLLEWVAFPFSRGSSQPRDLTQVSCVAGGFFTSWATREAQEYTEELYKKDLHDPDNHDGVITHLKPDILECEVKWTLGSITTNKASGGGGVQLSYFKS